MIGALRKFSRSELSRVVWNGTLSAVLLSVITALVLQSVGASLEGNVEIIFEGVTMLIAAGVLTWMVFWMHHQARHIKGDLEAGVKQATLNSGTKALFLLAFTAVLREGIELALFLTAATLASDSQQVLTGAMLGLGTSALLGWSLFASIVKLDLRRFFRVTGALLILFAAGLVAHGVHEFNEIGWIPSLVEHVWDINYLLNEDSTLGSILKALFGYNSNPSLTEVIAYLGYFGAIFLGLRRRLSSVPAVQEA